MRSNLPPGVTENMLPGSESDWWEQVLELLDDEVFEELQNNTQFESYTEGFDPTDDPRYVAEKVTQHYNNHYKQEDNGHD